MSITGGWCPGYFLGAAWPYAAAAPAAAATSRQWSWRTPCLRVVGDAREPPAQLDGARELAALPGLRQGAQSTVPLIEPRR
jgi:hypothetical protein